MIKTTTKTPKPKPKPKVVKAEDMLAIALSPRVKSTPAEIEARRAERRATPKPKPKVKEAPKPTAKPKPAPIQKETPRTDHEFTPADLTKWRESMALSQREAAKALGVARQSYSNYEAGKVPIPKLVALACQALAATR